MTLTLLQFLPEPDPRQTVGLLIILGVLTVAGILGALVSGKGGRRAKESRGAIRKRARRIGLNRRQRKMLLSAIKTHGVSAPMQLFVSPTYLTQLVRRMVSTIDPDLPPEEAERRRTIIYALQEHIDRNRHGPPLSSSRVLHADTPVKLQFRGGTWHWTRVIKTDSNGVLLERPATLEKQPAPDSPVKVAAVRSADHIYGFTSTVVQSDRVDPDNSMRVAHQKNLQHVQNRRSPRRELSRPAYVYPVHVVETTVGRKKTKERLINTAQRATAQLEDISVGGCALILRRGFDRGTQIRIDVDFTRGDTVRIFGQVRANVAVDGGRRCHVRFARLPADVANRIHSFVYDVEPEQFG